MVESSVEREFQRPVQEIGLGVGSACLGTIGLMLFFLPILSIPIALSGLLVGILGILLRGGETPNGFRWAIVGVILCSAVASFSSAIAYASTGEITDLHRPVQKTYQSGLQSTTVPPPARPGQSF
jgi:hypothetical protein